jgi:hypothetical protein
MTFDEITNDGRLWAVRYDGEDDNELYNLFDKWNNVLWLRNFFVANKTDLWLNYNMSSINEAVMDTIEDSEMLEAALLDLSPNAERCDKTDSYNAGTHTYRNRIEKN